jgi:hypothetical protein
MEEILLLSFIVLAVIQLYELGRIKKTLNDVEGGLRELRRKLPWQQEKSQVTPPPAVAAPEPVPAPAVVPAASPASAPVRPAPPQPPPVPVQASVATSVATPVMARSAPPPPAPNPTVEAALDVLRRIWSWIVVGEEHRTPGVSMEYAVATTWLIRAGIVTIVTCVGYFLEMVAGSQFAGTGGPRRLQRFLSGWRC